MALKPASSPDDSARARQGAARVVRTLRQAGHLAYFAGGCVRDELLGLHPSDYDVATDARPERVRALFPRTAEVGAAFGVVLVSGYVDDQRTVTEVATFRADGAYSDNRRPDAVHFSDPRADAARRDFTVNAMFLDPLAPDTPDTPDAAGRPGAHGAVIDYVGGREDLARRVLRAVGDPDQRLAEDHLRALRAVRLGAKLGFTLDPATADAIRRHATDLRGVSRERIGDELRRMLAHPTRATALRALSDLGLDAPVLDEPGAPAPAPTPPLPCVASLPPEAPVPVALAAWALDRVLPPTDPGAVRALVDRWRRALVLSNDEREALSALLRDVGAIESGWLDLPVARQKRSAGGAWFGAALALVGARDAQRAARARARLAELEASPGGVRPEPLVTGDDLVAVGLRPGPAFKRILDAVYDAQLEGRVGCHADGVELARRLGINTP